MANESASEMVVYSATQVRRLDGILMSANRLATKLTQILKDKNLLELTPVEKDVKLSHDETLSDFQRIYNAFMLDGGLNENKTFIKYPVMVQKLLLRFFAFLRAYDILKDPVGVKAPASPSS